MVTSTGANRVHAVSGQNDLQSREAAASESKIEAGILRQSE